MTFICTILEISDTIMINSGDFLAIIILQDSGAILKYGVNKTFWDMYVFRNRSILQNCSFISSIKLQ